VTILFQRKAGQVDNEVVGLGVSNGAALPRTAMEQDLVDS